MQSTSHMRIVLTGALAVVLAYGGSAAAAPSATLSLAKCQAAASAEGQKLLLGQMKAVSKCLAAVASEVIGKAEPDLAKPAKRCVSELRKLNDTRSDPKDLATRFVSKVTLKCDPASFNHTAEDVLGNTLSVAEPIGAAGLEAICASFGGDGFVDSISDWVDCMRAAHACEASQAVGVRFPRAPELLEAVREAMLAVEPKDPTQVIDAVAAVDAIVDAMDSNGDGIIDLDCGYDLRPQGAYCTTSTECQTGHCVEGVCCGSACDAVCWSCRFALTSDPEGTCATIDILGQQDTNPSILCGGAAGCATDSCACDGSGNCKGSDGSVNCGDGSECLIGACTGGICVNDGSPDGEACTTGNDCQAGHCVEGVCCESACDTSCLSCRSSLTSQPEGTCAAIDIFGEHDVDPAPLCNGPVGCATELCACDGGGNCKGEFGTSCSDGSQCLDGICSSNRCGVFGGSSSGGGSGTF